MTISWEESAGEDPRTGEQDPKQRFKLYRLCECSRCGGVGKVLYGRTKPKGRVRCTECRGEGKVRELVATCATPEDVGVALVTLGQEGDFENCPLGLLDCLGETGKRWLVRPWQPSPRQVSDAARVLARSKIGKGK